MISTAHPRRSAPLWARLVLLLCVVVGVGAMHTLGHLHSDHESGSSAQAMTAPAAAPADGSADRGEAADSAAPGERDGAGDSTGAGHMAAAAPDEGGGSDAPMPLDPTSVCLAFGGLALALLWVVTGAFRHWPGRTSPARTRPLPQSAVAGRPPRRPPSLSALQVLRV
ncbi:hypothetical protein ACFO4E_22105 [Nocardiopsis mangrovi]|uniref:Uncharacterized protein n=1 Tax=Nocardiopsis mangrovi TaxID=1179818 RepID=A0ABV9E0C0_9ACTN